VPRHAGNLRRFFREVPQAIHDVHSFRTARLRFAIAENSRLSESALTAGVNVTLLIAQGWFCQRFSRG